MKRIIYLTIVLILIGTALALEDPYYKAIDRTDDYRTWTYEDWKSSYPDLEIDDNTLNTINNLIPRADIKEVEAEYIDGKVVIKVKTVGDAFTQSELHDLLSRNILFNIGGQVRFNSSSEIVSIRVDYYTDPMDEQEPVKVEAYLYSKVIPTFEEEAPVSLSINGNEYVFTVSVKQDFTPLERVESDPGGAVLMFGDKIAYFWRIMTMELYFMEDVVVARFDDISSIETGENGEDSQSPTTPPVDETPSEDTGEESIETPQKEGEIGEEGGDNTVFIGIIAVVIVSVAAIIAYNKFIKG